MHSNNSSWKKPINLEVYLCNKTSFWHISANESPTEDYLERAVIDLPPRDSPVPDIGSDEPPMGCHLEKVVTYLTPGDSPVPS
ncbi:hypothetical protein JTB14_008458 [Gonioctena quinquepunctata]|nr:hypothetical protein JTB14_008458 [Gonioctena quinquepunctata]